MSSKLDLFFGEYQKGKNKGDVVALRFCKTMLQEMRTDEAMRDVLAKYQSVCKKLDELNPDNLDSNIVIANVVNGFGKAFNTIKTIKPIDLKDEQTYISTFEKYNYCLEVAARLSTIETLEYVGFYKRFMRSHFDRENGLNIPKE